MKKRPYSMSSKTFATKNQTDGKWWLVLYVGFVEQRVIFILLLGGVVATSYTSVACMLTTDDTNIARIFIIHFFVFILQFHWFGTFAIFVFTIVWRTFYCFMSSGKWDSESIFKNFLMRQKSSKNHQFRRCSEHLFYIFIIPKKNITNLV